MAIRKPSLSRKKPTRADYDLVLIVCEGSKTEPNYFNNLIYVERLQSANIVVTGQCGSDPVSVVEHAKDLYNERLKEKNPSRLYDRIFCVIDRDLHPNFNKAIDIIHQFNRNLGEEKLFSVKSFPSFEYWYLCHFKYMRGTFSRTGSKSAGDMCEAKLNNEWRKIHLENYNKNDPNVYSKLFNECDEAIKRAKRALEDAESTGQMNPSTEAHKLVAYLKSLKK